MGFTDFSIKIKICNMTEACNTPGKTSLGLFSKHPMHVLHHKIMGMSDSDTLI